MAKAIALFTGGTHNLRQRAIREDGKVFARSQFNSNFGKVWSSWQETGETLGNNVAANLQEMPAGFDNLRRAYAKSACLNDAAQFNANGALRIRLPN